MDRINWIETDKETIRQHMKKQKENPMFWIESISYDLDSLIYNILGLVKCIRNRIILG